LRAELLVDLLQLIGIGGRERLAAGRPRDGLQRLRRRRNARDLLEAADERALDLTVPRAEDDGVDRGSERPGTTRCRGRLDAADVRRAVRDDHDGGGRRLVASRAGAPREIDGEPDRVAERRAGGGPEGLEALLERGAVDRRRDDRDRAARE